MLDPMQMPNFNKYSLLAFACASLVALLHKPVANLLHTHALDVHIASDGVDGDFARLDSEVGGYLLDKGLSVALNLADLGIHFCAAAGLVDGQLTPWRAVDHEGAGEELFARRCGGLCGRALVGEVLGRVALRRGKERLVAVKLA